MDLPRAKQHVPEPLGPVEVHCQKETADDDQRKRDPVADARQIAAKGTSDQLDERGEEVRPCGNPAQIEIEDDPPAPFGVRDEEVHAGSLCSGGRVRSRNAKTTPRPVRIAAKMLKND